MKTAIENRVVFVTGGANSIGKSIVTLFCKNGADVIFCDINESAGRELSLIFLSIYALLSK